MTCTSLKYVFPEFWQTYDHHNSVSLHCQEITLPSASLRKQKPLGLSSTYKCICSRICSFCLPFYYWGQHALLLSEADFCLWVLYPIPSTCSETLLYWITPHLELSCQGMCFLSVMLGFLSYLGVLTHAISFVWSHFPTSSAHRIIPMHPSGLCLDAIYLDMTSLTFYLTIW